MNLLRKVFGETNASTLEDAARRSTRSFVRGRNQIGLYDPDRTPTGRIISAFEAFSAYGFDVLEEAIDYGSALLLKYPNAAGDALKRQRKALGLDHRAVCRIVDGVSINDLKRIENGAADDIPLSTIEKIAFAIGLDENQISFQKHSVVTSVAGRLRTMQYTSPGAGIATLSATAVTRLTEAASVIRTQISIQSSLRLAERTRDFEPSDDYGTSITPAWKVGYDLAKRTRRHLGIADGEPISSMRELVEYTLGIPVVQTELPQKIAGATISVELGKNKYRGVVLNTLGANKRPLVRRATLAHEVGHLLFDPDQHLDKIHVDSYDKLDSDPEKGNDRVEQRANAFAINFLALVETIRDQITPPFVEQHIIDTVSKFGISVTAARLHLNNAHYRNFEVPNLESSSFDRDKWRVAEDFGLDFFPVRETPSARRGRFSFVVVKAWEQKLISASTAASYLNCSEEAIRDKASTILSMFTDK